MSLSHSAEFFEGLTSFGGYSQHAMSVSRSSTMSSHSNSQLFRRCRFMVHVRPVEDKFNVVSLFSTCREFGYPVEVGEISSNKPYMGRLRWGLSSICPTSKKPSGTGPDGFKMRSMLSDVRRRRGKSVLPIRNRRRRVRHRATVKP